mmetsp:Transcript_23429/g.26000  ORF Transcript_23429/g.26000 Transcript_23429/m.26000 type:complete len:104 (-) Transcript_23429:711-1022(-)
MNNTNETKIQNYNITAFKSENLANNIQTNDLDFNDAVRSFPKLSMNCFGYFEEMFQNNDHKFFNDCNSEDEECWLNPFQRLEVNTSTHFAKSYENEISSLFNS